LPAAVTEVGDTDLARVSSGSGAVVGVLVDDGGEVTVVEPVPATLPLAVAVLSTEPCVTSPLTIV
jgi:hypothetical protein